MKRILSICLVAALALTLAACSSKAPSSSTPAPGTSSGSSSVSTPESQPAADKNYAQIIQDSRPAEDNDNLNIIGKEAGGELTVLMDPHGIDKSEYAANAEMLTGILGLDPASVESFAVSTTMINVRAYGVGIFKPMEGKTQEVMDALNGFVANQQKAFEQYLMDQYEITKAAIVEELPSGEVILVMCENAEDVAASLKEALK